MSEQCGRAATAGDAKAVVEASSSEREARRSKVCALLREGLDGKLLMGGHGDAVRLLAEAHRVATSSPRLHWPLPEAAAYRYAYVLMRTARTPADLRRVHRLLVEARTGVTLDPLQHALEVAVCERLGAADGKARASWRDRSRQAFARLAEAALRDDATGEGRALQGEVFNVVELCAFLLGEDYEGLYGRAALAPAPFPQRDADGFVLVGTGGVDHRVVMERRFAHAEFKARADAGEADVAFTWDDRPELVMPEPGRAPSQAGQHLPQICIGAPLLVKDQNGFAVALNRLRKAILVGPKLAALGPAIVSKRDDVCTFHPSVRALGLVARRHWSGSGAGRDR